MAALAHSKAWDMKVAVEVFWVTGAQVSKSAPTGLALPSGSFMIYGKKNFISPSKLEMGFALLWKVDEESAKRHVGERVSKLLEEGIDTVAVQPALQNDKPDDAELINTVQIVDKKTAQNSKAQ